MPRRRRFSTEPFGPTVERLMGETGVTYRGLAEQTGLSAGAVYVAKSRVLARLKEEVETLRQQEEN